MENVKKTNQNLKTNQNSEKDQYLTSLTVGETILTERVVEERVPATLTVTTGHHRKHQHREEDGSKSTEKFASASGLSVSFLSIYIHHG